MADEIDDATAEAILTAQFQDFDGLEGIHLNEDASADDSVALRLYHEKLERYAVSIRDRQMAIHFGESPLTNERSPEVPLNPTSLLQTHTLDPNPTIENFLFNATRNSSLEETPHLNAKAVVQEPAEAADHTEAQNVTAEVEATLSALVNDEEEDSIIETKTSNPVTVNDEEEEVSYGTDGTSSTVSNEDWHPASASEFHETQDPAAVTHSAEGRASGVYNEQHQFEDVEAQNACLVCDDESLQEELLHLPCGHYYRPECLVTLFNSAMKDESLFPPQCYGEVIPLSLMRDHFDDEFEDSFRKRQGNYLPRTAHTRVADVKTGTKIALKNQQRISLIGTECKPVVRLTKPTFARYYKTLLLIPRVVTTELTGQKCMKETLDAKPAGTNIAILSTSAPDATSGNAQGVEPTEETTSPPDRKCSIWETYKGISTNERLQHSALSIWKP
ncbi:MAG: hypothetical protein Q9166_003223 [cf. Caloplaca sp. 2 TL-2023]